MALFDPIQKHDVKSSERFALMPSLKTSDRGLGDCVCVGRGTERTCMYVWGGDRIGQTLPCVVMGSFSYENKIRLGENLHMPWV